MKPRIAILMLLGMMAVLSCDDATDPVAPVVTNPQAPAWVWASPRPTGALLTGVSWPDAGTAVIVGSLGTIMKSTDGGTTWKHVPSGTSVLLHSVVFRGRDGLIAGDDGVLLRSGDGGDHWTRVNTGTRNHLYSAYFAGAHAVVAVGELGKIVRVSDSGWVHPGNSSFEALFSVSFENGSLGLATGEYQTVLRTTDGGNTWAPIDAIPGNFTQSVTFADAQTVIGVTRNGIMRSVDAGLTWTNVLEYTARYLNSVAFVDPLTGIAIGEWRIMRTTDGGLNWAEISMPRSTPLSSVAFGDRDHGIAVGPKGTLFATSDGGLTWEEPWLGDHATDFGAVDFPTDATGYAVGRMDGVSGVVYRSNDAGKTWNEVARNTTYEFFAVSFTDPQHGLVLGRSAGSTHAIFLTNDGGQTLEDRFSGPNQLFNVGFADASTAIAVGKTIFRSTDGGVTWTPQTPVYDTNLLDVDFGEAGVGVAVGGRLIVRTEDGGATWTPIETPPGADLFAVDLVGTTAVAAAGYGLILRSENAGRSWVPFEGPPTVAVSISFSAAGEGYLLGTGPASIFATRDAWKTWEQEPGFTNERLYQLMQRRDGSVIVVGSDGLIMKK